MAKPHIYRRAGRWFCRSLLAAQHDIQRPPEGIVSAAM